MIKKFESYLRINKIISILREVDEAKLLNVVQALYAGGIRILEIAFCQQDPASFINISKQIYMLNKLYANRMLFGIGTVLSVEQVNIAADVGASFIVSPNTNIDVIKQTKEKNIVSIPGAMTPSEILIAHDCGADYVKVFPAATLGVAYVKAIRSPIRHVPLIAVGGIDETNAGEFIRAGACAVGVGGTLVNKMIMDQDKYKELEEAAKALSQITNSMQNVKAG